MRNISLPDCDYFEEFKNLVRRKKGGATKTLLQSMYDEIKTRYDEYECKRSTPENVTQVSRNANESVALESCYVNSNTFKYNLLKKVQPLEEAPTPRCPYCQINPATTWDHFLPASIFPDFFVYPPNLIRACSECNDGIKKQGLVTPVRKTVHPYYDPLSNHQYLKCTIIRVADEITATYTIDDTNTAPTYNAYVASVVKHHFKSYDLARKFRAESSRKIADFYVTLKGISRRSRKFPSHDIIKDIIIETIRDLQKRGEGINHWELVLWGSILAFNEFIQFFENKLRQEEIIE
jgi:hypothetical protein